MSIFDKINDEKKSIGFSYQDYVALKYSLELKIDESIGIEVFDDVHLENIYGQKTLIQVKHSINSGNNLTNKDIDLWKTLYNWSKSIEEINDKEINLFFYTNKPLTREDGFIRLINTSPINISNIRNEIKKIKTEHKNKDDELYKFISTINSLTKPKLERLFNSITFIYSSDEIIEQIKALLKTFAIPDNKIDDTFHNISGAFFEHKYKLVKDNKKIKITYNDFRKKLGIDRIIQISRSCINNFEQYYKFESAYPSNLDERVSYIQLTDINFDTKTVILFINHMAKTEAFIQSLKDDGELTTNEIELMYEKAYDEWQTRHSLEYMSENYNSICASHLSTATSLCADIIKCDISIENNHLPRPMIIGTFLKLSDTPRIGWLQHWESLYK
ncbi:hypothetical protein H8I69_23255 [Serratia fonticola]|uniref:hypothetical protein n=1 Tax=Serratia fonticola TaxID=47917 RepID=UPI0015C63979|nr:hypothetical protein [Serratia fonticola]MBC3382037.1 hypothetical protein [Serratia fonticola]NYA41236.1 hypothetical protein [Serratia fonticola]